MIKATRVPFPWRFHSIVKKSFLSLFRSNDHQHALMQPTIDYVLIDGNRWCNETCKMCVAEQFRIIIEEINVKSGLYCRKLRFTLKFLSMCDRLPLVVIKFSMFGCFFLGRSSSLALRTCASGG